MPFITLADYLLLPFYVLAIYGIAYAVRNRFYPPDHPWRPYFLPGLTVKVVGAIFIGLVYRYYYGGGDTSYYFYHAQVVNSAFAESPVKWVNLMLRIPAWYDGDYIQYTSQMEWYGDKASYTVVTIAAFLSMLCFNTFLPTSVLFAAISFTGIWAMFRTFARQYPHLTRQVALATLFIPSTFIWGSGIFKDTVCMFGLGWLIYSVFQVLIRRSLSISGIVLTILLCFLLARVKVYILIAFLPALALWILFTYSHKIKIRLVRSIVKLSTILIAALSFVFISNEFSAQMGRYSLDNIAKTSYVTRQWIFYSSGDEGSTYDLGEFSPTFSGMLSKFPQAVNVTLFRPYLWEAKKVIVMMNALEAFLFLLLTLKVLIRVGPVKVYKSIAEDPNIQFSLIFVLIFAFAVGISSYNFGALSRYKIPCLPLYGLTLILIYYKHNSPEKPFLSFR
jgi:hypothetical protein